MAHEPFAVAQEAPGQPEELNTDDGEGERGLGRVLGGPGDQPGRRAHERDRGADGARSEERGAGQPAPHRPRDAERAPRPRRAVAHRRPPSSPTSATAAGTGAGGSSTTRSASAASAGRWATISAVRPSTSSRTATRTSASRLVVQAGRRLVEQEQRRVAHEGARQGEALALAGGEAGPALAQRRVDAPREVPHDLGQAGGVERGRHVCIAGVRPPQPDVLGHGAGRRGAAAAAPRRGGAATRRGRPPPGRPRPAAPCPRRERAVRGRRRARLTFRIRSVRSAPRSHPARRRVRRRARRGCAAPGT